MARQFEWDNSRFLISAMLVLMLVVSCGGGGGDGGGDDNGTASEVSDASQLMDDFNHAALNEDKVKALTRIAGRCESIGIIDQDSTLLNSVPPQIDISLDQDDMRAYASSISAGHYRTLGSIIEFLADMGVVLSSTDALISFEDVQQDIQDYVNWSFANQDDPAGTLGLLIASGTAMALPDSPPVIAKSTRVNLFTAMLIVGDILIGVDGPQPQALNRAGLSDTAESILGLLVQIEPELYLVLSKKKLPIYKKIKELIVLFGVGNSLQAFFMDKNDGAFEPVESITLFGFAPRQIYAGTLLIPDIDLTPEPIGKIKPHYTLTIEDTDDFPVAFDNKEKTLTFASSLFPPENPFHIRAEKLTDKSSNSATLNLDVKFEIPDLDALIETHKSKLGLLPRKMQTKLQDPVFMDSVKTFITQGLKITGRQLTITPAPVSISTNVVPPNVTDALVGDSIDFEAKVAFDPEEAENMFDVFVFSWQVSSSGEDTELFEDAGSELTYTFQNAGDHDILVVLYGMKNGTPHYLDLGTAHIEVSEAPTGACCNDNTGTCTETTEKECDFGTYMGDDVACREDLCSQPLGACCSDEGTCAEKTMDDCNQGGGTYEGNNFTCEPNPCTKYTGACCGAFGVCYTTGQALCESAGDTFKGTGTTCTPGLCPAPLEEEWVVFTIDNGKCFDGLILTVRERTDFEKAEKLCFYWYYGDNTCTVTASKSEVRGNFATRNDAYAWIDSQKGEWVLNRWCPGNGYYKISGIPGAEYFMIF